jgi:glutamyl-tRNA reductase
MRLLVVGLSHRTAPIELRECVDFARGGLEVALKALAVQAISQESVVLSTCNRAEVYAVVDSDVAGDRIARFFSEYHQLEHRETVEHLYTLSGGDAARHLFRVAAGLDSLVVGEPQILGQVKSAYTVASDLQLTGPLEPAVPLVVRRREARALRDGAGRRRGLGQLRGDRAGQEDLR